MSATVLEVRDVTVGYGKNEPVLHDISIVLAQGTILGVVGMNGAGKSTLMRTVAGMLTPRAGEVLFEGRRINGRHTAELARRGVVLLPEGHRVLRPLTVRENLRIATMSLAPRKVRKRVSEAEGLIYELFPILERRSSQLAGLMSGGEQQMLSIARAIMQRPKVLLLDEPSLGLAPRVIGEIYAALGRLRETADLAMLIVEQNSDRLAAHCEELVVLRDGKVSWVGPSRELNADRLHAAYFG
ncbi:MAG TPA: ABC transporter ATP-binding protein [Amycolatopsis sp.]|nr:ABC transporter ATP-binding protein [Amycolatopsis sp.]